MAEAEKKVTLKLLVDKMNDAVLFAEAGKDFVDFLFHILTLPIGTVIRLKRKSGMVGSLGNLYDSIENLNDTYYIKPSSDDCDIKGTLLKPMTATYIWSAASTNVPLLLPPKLASSGGSQKTYYRATMNRRLNLVEAPQHKLAAADNRGGDDSRGYVKGVVTYMVMDDLLVKPMSTISSITLLNKFNVTDLNCLDEKVVEFGMGEAVALLKASLESKTALTDVFLAGKRRSDQ